LAAFELGRYAVAERYLKAAVTANPHDAEGATRLKITELVLQMDPFQQRIPNARKNQIVVEAFAAAGQRLKSCNMQNASVSPEVEQPNLAETWLRMKPSITTSGLRRQPDLVGTAMDPVFRIERETGSSCGPPSGTHTALLLVAKEHEGG
jgi:hypothetical protein